MYLITLPDNTITINLDLVTQFQVVQETPTEQTLLLWLSGLPNPARVTDAKAISAILYQLKVRSK